MAEGVDGLLRDKTRPPGTPPLPEATVERVVELTRERAARRGHALDRAGDGRGRGHQPGLGAGDLEGARARAAPGADLQALQGPRVHRQAARHRRALHEPAGARLVLSVDEKSQIQALDRTQPGLPMKAGQPATMTHDYIRHGTTTLFAALNVLDGTVLGRCMQRHRHQEFIRFLNAVEAAVPAGKLIHVVLDNYAAHKHPKVRAWLERHPRWTFHFTPTSCSWLNAVEGFFAVLTKRRLRRGSFGSLVDLQAAINRYLASTTPTPNPSSGPPSRTASSRRSGAGIKRLSRFSRGASAAGHPPARARGSPACAGAGTAQRRPLGLPGVRGRHPDGRLPDAADLLASRGMAPFAGARELPLALAGRACPGRQPWDDCRLNGRNSGGAGTGLPQLARL